MSPDISDPGVIDREKIIDVNLKPVFPVTQAVLPNMRAKEGRITLCSA
jgi:NADP-dependent 3-hydroxy acid dehydrogenase YdfG